jgi:cyclic pyranopterin phosphate synthase
MLDRFKRDINYLRVSVTDRCNLRCEYCMPEEGIELISRDEILSIEEIAEVVKVGAEKIGIKKIRLTGGEPLVRKGIVDLVGMIAGINGIEELSMTTNATLLPEFAADLRRAGLDRVNISLDTLSPGEYRRVTRGGEIQKVFDGIRAARDAGLTPIKINVVKTESMNEDDLAEIKEFCRKEDLEIRHITLMNLKQGTFSKVEGGSSGDCATCNRLRLMANGNIKPCLFSNEGFNIREHGIENAFLKALNIKPERGETSDNHQFYNIGG